MRAVPGAGLKVPIWILGSSLFGAQVAAALGLPFSFASHFAPQLLHEAIDVYRDRFTPSEHSQAPYVMLGVNIVAADTDAEARFLASSGRQSFASLRAGRPITLPPPSKEWERDPCRSTVRISHESDARVVRRIAGDDRRADRRSSSRDEGR